MTSSIVRPQLTRKLNPFTKIFGEEAASAGTGVQIDIAGLEEPLLKKVGGAVVTLGRMLEAGVEVVGPDVAVDPLVHGRRHCSHDTPLLELLMLQRLPHDGTPAQPENSSQRYGQETTS